MNLNDFSKWLQYNKVKNLRGSEYFPYPLYMSVALGSVLLAEFGPWRKLIEEP